MTYTDDKQYFAAYTYGLERIKVEAMDDTRPESQDPIYNLHDGLGSARQLTRPNGAARDHYNNDGFGVPAPGAKYQRMEETLTITPLATLVNYGTKRMICSI